MSIGVAMLVFLILFAFLAGWFSRIFMEKHRAAQTAELDAVAAKVGDAANGAGAAAKAEYAKLAAKRSGRGS